MLDILLVFKNNKNMQRIVSFLKRYPELAATLAVGITAAPMAWAHQPWVQWYVSAFALIMAAILAWNMVKEIMAGAWGVDLLAITAIISTVLVGEYWAALIVCLMLSGGEALEDYAGQRARSQLTGLLEGAPTTAHKLDGNDIPTDVAIETIEIGDHLLIRPGEVIPVDGTLQSDTALTEESSLTGEPLPVEHKKGDKILSGGVNGSDAITITATARAADSEYQKIIELVQQAQDSQAPVVRLADRVAVPFTIIAFIIAGVAFWISGDPVRIAQVLVVATPCPLLIAAPVAFLAGMNRAAKEGIIIKDSGTLERLAKIQTIAIDKTGTLTHGHPELIRILIDQNFDAQDVLAKAAAVETHSSHPLAAAVVTAAQELGTPTPPATGVSEQTGKGVIGTVSGQLVEVGSGRWLDQNQRAPEPQAGQILIHIRIDNQWAGAFVMQDVLRKDAKTTIETFKNSGVEHVMMITGDGETTAKSIAHEVGIDEVHASLLPKQKVDTVNTASHPVAAVGDGVNDAPVLATADVGIAMGARGSSAASESADVVVMHDDIYRASRTITIGKRTMRVAMQAIGIGIGLSILLMIIGAAGIMPAVVGAFMQEIVDLACILWALLAARPSKEEIPVEDVLAANSQNTKRTEYRSLSELVERA